MKNQACVYVRGAGGGVGTGAGTRSAADLKGAEIDGVSEADVEAEGKVQGSVGLAPGLERVVAFLADDAATDWK